LMGDWTIFWLSISCDLASQKDYMWGSRRR